MDKSKAIAMADKVIEMTMAQIKALPNMLGIIASSMAAEYGFYGYNDVSANQKVCIVLKA